MPVIVYQRGNPVDKIELLQLVVASYTWPDSKLPPLLVIKTDLELSVKSY